MGPALDRLAQDIEGQLRLIDAATADDPQRAWLGVEGLARSVPPQGLGWVVQAVLVDALHADRAATRRAAAWALLGYAGSDLALDALSAGSDDPDPLTRLLCLRGAALPPQSAWPRLAPLFETSEIAIRFEAYQLSGVLGLTAAIPTLQDAVHLEGDRLRRTALTALARLDPAAAIALATDLPDGTLALIDAPIALPPILREGVDPRLHERQAGALDPGRSRAWPRTHRRLLAPIAAPPSVQTARSALLAHSLTPAQCARVDAAIAFLHARAAPAVPGPAPVATLGHLVDRSADNRYRPPAHAHQAPDVAPSIKALATDMGIV